MIIRDIFRKRQKTQQNQRKNTIGNANLWIVLTGDAVLVAAAYYAAYLFRFEGTIAAEHVAGFQKTVLWVVPVYLKTFHAFKQYRGMWRYTSLVDSLNLFKSVAVATGVTIVLILLIYRFDGFSRSVFIINGMLIFLMVGGFRILIRLIYTRPVSAGRIRFTGAYRTKTKNHSVKNLLIIGAGSAGDKLIRELKDNRNMEYNLVGLVDDDPQKLRQTLHGVPVLGAIAELKTLVAMYRVDEIIIAIPSASMQQMRNIVETCKAANTSYKTLPGIGDIIQGKVTLNTVRDVCYDDLLKRAPIVLDNDRICGYLANKRVMVTGGAGSIGSELCRQIAGFSPAMLVIVERSESALYELALDIQAAFPELKVISALAAVQNQERMAHVFSRYQPQAVFHAAAYKHVPMMENHPWEAIFNNVVGSSVVLRMCHQFKAERCVIVSTDKAVRPTNVMGATKRFVELLTQTYASLNSTRYMAVRFGNVLGSAGSVLPLFKKQIAQGGPVTVTDPDMTRFFMTIPEACSLILQSGAYGNGGEIFVLKMGTPVRIDDMARDLISLSGYQPDEDIAIRYTGLRPGEKLYEELITQGEGIRKTEHDDIMILDSECHLTKTEAEAHIKGLVGLARQGDADGLKRELSAIIPEYCPWKECQPVTRDKQSIKSGQYSPIPGLTHLSHGRGVPVNAFLYKVAAEDRLLLQLLSGDAPDESADGSCALPLEALPVPDWEKIIQSAVKRNLATLLYVKLRRAGLMDQVPLKIQERFRKIYLYHVQTAFRQKHWIGQLLALFDTRGVPVLMVGGLPLSESVYGNIAAKPFSNVTFFISQTDMHYRRVIRDEISRLTSAGGVTADIADAISYPNFENRMPLQAIWRRSHAFRIFDYTVNIPCPEDVLVHLCLTLAFQYEFRFTGLRILCDIHEVLLKHGGEFNWDIVLNLSNELSVNNVMGVTLMLTQELMKTPISSETIKKFGAPDQFTFVKQLVMQNMFSGQPYRVVPQHFVELWEGKLPQKVRALYRLIHAPYSSVRHTHTNGILKNAYLYTTQLVETLSDCLVAATMLIVNDKEMMAYTQQEKQNTQIREWFLGRMDLKDTR